MRLLPFLVMVPLICVPASSAHASDPEAVHLLSKAVRAYDQEDYGGAKIALERALEIEPNFSEAYLLKGLLQYHDGQMEKAGASFDTALKLNPRLPNDMRKHLEKRAHALESRLTEQDFSHFHLQFNGAEQREQAWQAVKHLDDAYRDLGSRFALYPDKRFSVIIFTSQEFMEAWYAPMWLGGFFDTRDGQIRIRIDPPPGGDEEYKRRLRHEYTHAFIHHLTKKELPVWFHEGVAQFYSYANPSDGFWKANRLDELAKITRKAPWMDFSAMEQAIRKKNVSPLRIYLAYLQAEALVLYVAKERGDSWIPSLMERVRRGMSFEEAFQDVVGVPPERMLENVQRLIS